MGGDVEQLWSTPFAVMTDDKCIRSSELDLALPLRY